MRVAPPPVRCSSLQLPCRYWPISEAHSSRHSLLSTHTNERSVDLTVLRCRCGRSCFPQPCVWPRVGQRLMCATSRNVMSKVEWTIRAHAVYMRHINANAHINTQTRKA
jgi:hypothetical protein